MATDMAADDLARAGDGVVAAPLVEPTTAGIVALLRRCGDEPGELVHVGESGTERHDSEGLQRSSKSNAPAMLQNRYAEKQSAVQCDRGIVGDWAAGRCVHLVWVQTNVESMVGGSGVATKQKRRRAAMQSEKEWQRMVDAA